MNKLKNVFKSLSVSTITAVLVVSLCIAPLTGCNTSQQANASALVQTLGTTVAQIENLEGNTAVGQTITTDTAAAVNAINNWVPGTPTQNISQALGLVVKDLNLLPIPVSDTDKTLIAIGVSTAQALLTEFGTAKVGLENPATHAVVLKASAAHTKQLQDDFKTKVNAVVANDQSRAFLTVK